MCTSCANEAHNRTMRAKSLLPCTCIFTCESSMLEDTPQTPLGRSLQAPQSSSMFGTGADSIMAAGVRPRSFDAAPGSPLSRRAAATTHSRANSRSFDAAPGSPLAQRAVPDTEADPQQQVERPSSPFHARPSLIRAVHAGNTCICGKALLYGTTHSLMYSSTCTDVSLQTLNVGKHANMKWDSTQAPCP